MFEWNPKSRKQDFIASNTGYKISFALIKGVVNYAAWPPIDEGNLYSPPRANGRYKLAIYTGFDINAAKTVCYDHWCKANGYEDDDDLYDQQQLIPGNTADACVDDIEEIKKPKPKGLILPPGVKPVENPISQGKQKTAAAMVGELGYSEGRAKHVLAGREEKKQLRIRLFRVRDWAVKNNISEFSFTDKEIYSMKPKELKQTIEKANVYRDSLK